MSMLDEYVSQHKALARRKAYQARTMAAAAMVGEQLCEVPVARDADELSELRTDEISREKDRERLLEQLARESIAAAAKRRDAHLESRRAEVMAAVASRAIPSIPIRAIRDVVCRRYAQSIDVMTSDRRDKHVVRPRQIAMYLSRTLTLRSLPEIGRRFGGRDHTTVLHAVRKISAMMDGGTVKKCGVRKKQEFEPDHAFRGEVERLIVEVIEAVEDKER